MGYTSRVIDEDREKNNKVNDVFAQALNSTRDKLFTEEKNRQEGEKLEVQKNRFEELINHATKLYMHQKYEHDILVNIFEGNTESKFFEIVSMSNFSEEIDSFRKLLPEDHMILNVSAIELLDLSIFSYVKNDTHVRLSVNVPIVNRKTYDLKEFIPVPKITNKRVSILNLNSAVYLDFDGKVKIIPYEDFNHCEKLNNLTICNSMIQQSFMDPSSCLKTLIEKLEFTPCEYKNLETKNYFMELSKHSFYCSIVEPIILRINCNGVNYMRNLEESEILTYSDHCNVFSSNDSSEFSRVKDFELDFTYKTPNFTIYDNILKDWTYNYTELNRRNIESIATNDRLINSLNDAINSEYSGSIFFNMFSGVKTFFTLSWVSNWMDNMIIKYVLMPVALFMCVVCLCSKPKRR